jgi:hypothetical protein
MVKCSPVTGKPVIVTYSVDAMNPMPDRPARKGSLLLSAEWSLAKEES